MAGTVLPTLYPDNHLEKGKDNEWYSSLKLESISGWRQFPGLKTRVRLRIVGWALISNAAALFIMPWFP